MFLEQTEEYTITSDDDQWILIWHPDGIHYQKRKDGGIEALPRGRRSCFGRLHHLTSSLLDRKARRCENLVDLNKKLKGFTKEMERINKLEGVR